MFKFFRKNCCGLDVHKTWIYACIGITDANSRTEYFQARFSSFSKGLQELALWLDKYNWFLISRRGFLRNSRTRQETHKIQSCPSGTAIQSSIQNREVYSRFRGQSEYSVTARAA